jgi:hypothetical protein
VHDGDVVIRFGPGLLHFRYRLTEFVSASAVRNRWWYGFGIHMGFKSILYNVSGLDAVELVKRDGRCVRIGTDEPKALEQALRAAIAAANINTPESWQELHDSEEQP